MINHHGLSSNFDPNILKLAIRRELWRFCLVSSLRPAWRSRNLASLGCLHGWAATGDKLSRGFFSLCRCSKQQIRCDQISKKVQRARNHWSNGVHSPSLFDVFLHVMHHLTWPDLRILSWRRPSLKWCCSISTMTGWSPSPLTLPSVSWWKRGHHCYHHKKFWSANWSVSDVSLVILLSQFQIWSHQVANSWVDTAVTLQKLEKLQQE